MSSLEQAFVGRDEKRAPLKTPAWEARLLFDQKIRGRPPPPRAPPLDSSLIENSLQLSLSTTATLRVEESSSCKKVTVVERY